MAARATIPSLLLAAALAACQSEPGSDLQSTASTTGSVLTITADGVPGLAAGTPYAESAFEERLPGYDASAIVMATETATPSAIALFKDGLQVVQVLPGAGRTIGAVHGVSTRLRGPAGERIGMTLKETAVDPATCREGRGNWSGMPICPSRGAPNVSLVFSTTGLAAATESMSAATLERIIWTPAESGA